MPKSIKKSLLSSSLFVCIIGSSIGLGAFAYNNAISAPNSAPTSLKQDLKAYGFDKKSKNFTYASGQVTDTQAVFNNVKFGTEFVASNMTLVKDSSNAVKIILTNPEFNSVKSKLTASSAIILDQTPHENGKATFFNIEDKGQFKGNFEFNNLELLDKQKYLPIKMARMSVLGFEANDDKYKFSSLELNGTDFQEGGIKMFIGGIRISGISDNLFNAFKSEGGMTEKPDFSKILSSSSIGHFQIADIKITPSASTLKTRNALTDVFKEAKLGNFEIKNFNRKLLERFAFENFALSMVKDNEDINLKLKELSFKDINIYLFENALKYMQTSNNLADSDEKTKPVKLNDDFLNQKAIDILKGGPLDFGIGGFAFDGFEASGLGMVANIDGFNFETHKDSEGIIDSLKTPNAIIKFGFVNKSKPLAAIAYNFLQQYGMDSVNIKIQNDVIFDKQTDRLSYNKNLVQIDKIGYFNFTSQIDGLLNYYKTESADSFFKTRYSLLSKFMPKPGNKTVDTIEEKEVAKSADTKPDIKPETEVNNATSTLATKEASKPEEPPVDYLLVLKNYLTGYNGVKFVKSSIELKDLGLLGILTNMEAASSGTKPADIRKEWAKPLNEYAANKSNPAIFREVALGAMRFINNGGGLNINIAPPAPILFKDLIDEKATKQSIGLTVTNQK